MGDNDSVIIKAERAVNAVINSMMPLPTCSEKRRRAIKEREKVKQELAARLYPLGPTQLKGTSTTETPLELSSKLGLPPTGHM